MAHHWFNELRTSNRCMHSLFAPHHPTVRCTSDARQMLTFLCTVVGRALYLTPKQPNAKGAAIACLVLGIIPYEQRTAARMTHVSYDWEVGVINQTDSMPCDAMGVWWLWWWYVDWVCLCCMRRMRHTITDGRRWAEAKRIAKRSRDYTIATALEPIAVERQQQRLISVHRMTQEQPKTATPHPHRHRHRHRKQWTTTHRLHPTTIAVVVVVRTRKMWSQVWAVQRTRHPQPAINSELFSSSEKHSAHGITSRITCCCRVCVCLKPIIIIFFFSVVVLLFVVFQRLLFCPICSDSLSSHYTCFQHQQLMRCCHVLLFRSVPLRRSPHSNHYSPAAAAGWPAAAGTVYSGR